MSNLNQFESVFRRALRKRFEYQEVKLEKILIITDGEEKEAYSDQIQSYLKSSFSRAKFELDVWDKKDFAPWPQIKDRLHRCHPDLVITHRMLWESDIHVEKSLGSYIDLLSQDTDYPLLVTPHPRLFPLENVLKEKGGVLVATEHLYDDHTLINMAIKFASKESSITLVHIEDEDTFQYYMEAISKIPDIPDELAEKRLREQLLAGPMHYAESVREVFREKSSPIRIESCIEFGHLIKSYRKLMKSHVTDLLVVNTKDDTQLAMHSIGYSLAVEFRETPVLLL
jgi:hypothetical protein